MTRSDLPSDAPLNSLRVALVVTSFPVPERPHRGIFNLRAAQSLGRHAEVIVIHTRAWAPGRAAFRSSVREGVRVVTLAVPQLPGEHPANATVRRRLGWPLVRSLVRRCDLLHSVNGWGAGVVASTWAHWAQVRHVSQMIGSDVNLQFPRTRRHPCLRGWERHVHAVACNSQALTHAFQRLYPHVPHVCTVYRGVDLDRFHPEGPVAGPLADSSGVRFLFMGGFKSGEGAPGNLNLKGGETLMAAWQAAELELVRSGAWLLVAGPGSRGERVVQWRAALRAPERVHLAGDLPPELVSAYLRAADVVVVPSQHEGLPNAAMEAAACGRAVLASAVGGIPEVVVPGHTGQLLPAGSVPAWQQALAAHAGDPVSLRRWGEHARQYVQAHFDARQFAPRMLDLYRVALTEPLKEPV